MSRVLKLSRRHYFIAIIIGLLVIATELIYYLTDSNSLHWLKDLILTCLILSLIAIILFAFSQTARHAQKIAHEMTLSLQESENKIRTLMNISPVGIYHTDKDGQCIYANPRWQEIAGFSLDQAMGQGWTNAIHPDDQKMVFENWNGAVASKKPFNLDFRFKKQDGIVTWVNSQAAPLIRNNAIDGYIGTVLDITDRKLNEDDLLLSVDKFKTLFDQSDDIMILIDQKNLVVDCNKAAMDRLTASKYTTIIHQPIEDILLMDHSAIDNHIPTISELISKARKSERMKLEWLFRDSLYLLTPCEITFKKVTLNERQLLLIHIHDLTIRKQIEEDLKKTSLQLQLAIDGSNDGLWDWDLMTDRVYYSPRWKEQLGFTYNELENDFRTWEKLCHPEDLINAKDAIQRHLSGEAEFYSCEHRLKHRDGSWRWILGRGRCARNTSGHPIRMVGFNTDVTEQKNALHQQKRDQQFLVDTIETIDAGFVVFDKDHRLVLCNSMYARMYDLPSFLAVPGALYQDILAFKSQNGIVIDSNSTPEIWITNRMRQHQKQHKLFDEYHFKDKHIRVTDRRTVDNFTVCLHNDITKFKLQAEQLQKAKLASEEANRVKSDFLATMSHEIRTPLNGILGMSDILLGTPLSAEQNGFVQTLRFSAQSLMTIINDILDYSKLEAGKLAVESIVFKMHHTIERVIDLLHSSAEKKAIGLRVDIPRDVPTNICGDPVRLQQILFNLIGNAIKFTQSGEVRLSLSSLSPSEKTCVIRFEISDTGIGISKAALSTLFTRFTQSDSSTTRKYGGSGLGLSICKQLVELMGGRIGAYSEEGKGSTFWFEIPFAQAEHQAFFSDIESSETPLTAESDSSSGGTLQLLVAEDNKVNQMVISAMLKKLGHQIDIAQNGFEVLEAVKQKKYDIILMDIQMPDMDGIQATKAIRKMSNGKSEIPIIAITANAMQGDKESYLLTGMNDYVSKPISLPDLVKAINRVRNTQTSTKQDG